MSSMCEFQGSCTLFAERLSDMPGLAMMFRARYCDAEFERCARFALADRYGRAFVPEGLMPNNHEWAREVGESLAVR